LRSAAEVKEELRTSIQSTNNTLRGLEAKQHEVKSSISNVNESLTRKFSEVRAEHQEVKS